MQKNFGRGFTLIELLVVITVIAVLASIALPVYTGVQEKAKVTQDMSNLRQIGLATQLYLNDNDNTYFLPTDNWMKLLHPKYLPAWKIFQSPFDTRSPSEDDSSTQNPPPISYGLSANTKPGGGSGSSTSLSSDKIINSSSFILFAPAQSATGTRFQGTPSSPVTVTQNSAGPGGTSNRGQRISACFADLHVESISWSTFSSDSADSGAICSGGGTPSVSSRWHPDPCNP